MTTLRLRHGTTSYRVRVGPDGQTSVEGPSVPGQTVRLRRLDETTYEVTDPHDHRHRIVHIVASDTLNPDDGWWVFIDGDVFECVPIVDRPETERRHEGAPSLASPMPATVRQVHASPGQAVLAGETLILLEAMKMELPLRAPRDGVIASVACREGDLVKPGTPLVVLKAEHEDESAPN